MRHCLALAGLLLAIPVGAQSRDTRALPGAIVAALKAAPTQGDLVSITNTDFSGQVLKADTISFASKSRLRFTGKQPFVAVVARRILISAPVEGFTIVTGAGPIAERRLPRQPPPPRARDGEGGAPGYDGQDGAYGASGKQGPGRRPGPRRPDPHHHRQ
jgi:hypothetical protein